ncbi:hypothetical protein B7463_g12477, partial [Scytalidium lignicola]
MIPQTPNPTPPPSPKFYNIRTSYNEYEIVGLITELFELLLKLAYFSNDQVTWPPQEGHKINETLCKELHLEPAVISLMKKIPYVDERVELFPRSFPYSFLDDDNIIASRDPERIPPHEDQESDFRVNNLLPHDIALSYHWREEGLALALDTSENTIRLIPWEIWGDDLVGLGLERPEDPTHYRNLPAQHAPSYFRSLIERIKSLELIPAGSGQFGREYHDSTDHKVRNEVKTLLTDIYGWPDDFRQDAWFHDVEEVWDYVIRKALRVKEEKARERRSNVHVLNRSKI